MPVEVELVRIALQAYGAGDIELALELCDPLVRWDERSARPDGELVWGRKDVEKAMRIYQEDDWDDYNYELQKLKAMSPGRVVGIYREWGTSYDGLPVDRRLGGLWVVESRLIVSWNGYLTPKEAIRAGKMLSDSVRFRDAETPERGDPGGVRPAQARSAES